VTGRSLTIFPKSSRRTPQTCSSSPIYREMADWDVFKWRAALPMLVHAQD
jgi:hypothetical protein